MPSPTVSKPFSLMGDGEIARVARQLRARAAVAHAAACGGKKTEPTWADYERDLQAARQELARRRIPAE